MQLKQLLDDNDAVSPVIGVILMVAITVILAAVIGTFVLGLGDQVQDTAPNAQFSWDQGEYSLDVTHEGGPGIAAADLKVTGDAVENGGDSGTVCDNYADEGDTPEDYTWPNEEVTAGNTCTVLDGASDSNSPEGTYRLIWDPAGSDQSQTLSTHNAD